MIKNGQAGREYPVNDKITGFVTSYFLKRVIEEKIEVGQE
jgi:hypothetical protein